MLPVSRAVYEPWWQAEKSSVPCFDYNGRTTLKTPRQGDVRELQTAVGDISDTCRAVARPSSEWRMRRLCGQDRRTAARLSRWVFAKRCVVRCYPVRRHLSAASDRAGRMDARIYRVVVDCNRRLLG